MKTIPVPKNKILPNEQWQQLPARYDQDYWVSSFGRVWSCKKRNGTQGRILKLQSHGYESRYPLSNACAKKVKIRIRICMVIAEVFVPNPNNWKYVHRLNGNICDDRAENLIWVQSKGYNTQEEDDDSDKIVYPLSERTCRLYL